MEDVDHAVNALARRIATGEPIDIGSLPEALRAQPLVQRLLRVARLADAFARASDGELAPPDRPTAPECIGPWRLLRMLGAGGMGDVWLGERTDGTVEHRVAIKRVRGASSEFARRLESERRILARLSHPHIARFIDAGVDTAGAPWLALEYVDGIDLNDWCETRAPTLAQRLRLFLQLCSAVEHAHRLLVVHRDIKPSNVIVEEDGTPRLLDFGVAKLLDDSIGDLTAAAFTPAYAAPEQLQAGVVSTATDVYALGLLLYRLLAGGLPETRRDLSLPVVLARLHEEEAQRPSRTAQAHAQALPYAPQQLAGDLDAVVSKAIRARPEDRYGAVAELAADVQRHLDARPVVARAPSRGYRLGRWLRRNRVAAGFAAAAALSLLAGTGASLWLAQREAGAAERASAQAARAEHVKRFVMSVFSEYDPIARAGAEASPRALVAEGIARAEQELADDPTLQRAVLADLGRMEAALGDPVRAAQRLEALDAATGESDALDRARLRIGLANALLQAGRMPDADRVAASAVPVLVGRLAADDLERLDAEFLQARIGALVGRVQAAIEQAQSIHARRVALHGDRHPEAISLLVSMGSWQTAAGRLAEGEKTLAAAIALIEEVRGPEHPTLAYSLMQLGTNQRRQGRLDEALTNLERASRLLERAMPAGHRMVASSLLLYAEALRAADRLDETEAVLDRVVPMVREGSPEQAHHTMVQGQLAGARGQHAAAAERFHAAFVAFRDFTGEKSPVPWNARAEQGRMLLLAGDVDAAAPVVEEAFAKRELYLPPASPDRVASLQAMGDLRAAQARGGEALGFYRRALEHHEAVDGPTHPRSLALRRRVVEQLLRGTAPDALAIARVEVDAWIERDDSVGARALSAVIAARAAHSTRAAVDLARARAIAEVRPEPPMTARERAWLDSGVPITIVE